MSLLPPPPQQIRLNGQSQREDRDPSRHDSTNASHSRKVRGPKQLSRFLVERRVRYERGEEGETEPGEPGVVLDLEGGGVPEGLSELVFWSGLRGRRGGGFLRRRGGVEAVRVREEEGGRGEGGAGEGERGAGQGEGEGESWREEGDEKEEEEELGR